MTAGVVALKSDVLSVFGEWARNPEAYAPLFQKANPFEHVQIPDFWAPDVAEALISEFPNYKDPNHDWKHYDNPIEQKWALNNMSNLPKIQAAFEALQSPLVLELFQKITGIEDLETDPHLHGAGLHAMPRGAKLDVHLDYSIHPISGKERRVNLLVYMNKQWKPEWGGALQLWDADRKQTTKVVTPGWNSAVLFRTSDISYHGLPRPIECPPEIVRQSIAIYYVSPARANAAIRPKAEFFPDPEQEVDPKLAKLYEIRKHRIITPEDLAEWPTWRQDGKGWW